KSRGARLDMEVYMKTNNYSGLLKSKFIEIFFMLLLGICFVGWPGAAVKMMLKAVGIICIIIGTIAFIAFFAAWKGGGTVIGDILTMILGIPFLILGIMIFVKPNTFLDFQGLFFGLLLMVHAVVEMVQSYLYVRLMGGKWWIHMILPIITMILAIIILADPFGAAKSLVVFMGIVLLYSAVSSLVFFIKTLASREKF
ncbi:MAG TPA: hypothetical protein DEO82_00020, partial [Eubacterium sp.]|nr:hypothetical protein [Eubacterium sp.]